MRQPTGRFIAYALILTLVGSIFSLALPTIQPSYAAGKNISVEIDDISYRQGDEVTITGSIDDHVTDEDQVTIKVKEPDGHVDADEDVDLDSHDEFDLIYDVSNTADDGIYTVEVQYDGESVFSYFIVDEEDDTVTVETNDDTYSGGDDIVISGSVDTFDPDEDHVVITIKDPNNDEILDSKSVDLGVGSGVDEDEFKYTFTGLDNDADAGRYTVLVTYDVDDQEGSSIFEVEGSSSNNDQITAELSDDSYSPGNTVSLTGTIDTVDNDLDLEIEVRDATDHLVTSDHSVDVQSDGDFEFEFDLADDADDGEYTVTITYGDDDKELTFDVGAGSGSTTSHVTVKLNKVSYLAGETITVTGTVPKIVKDEDVNILAYDKNSIFINSAQYVTPGADRTYTAALKLKSDLKIEDGYQVRVDYNGEEAKVTFSIVGQLTGSDLLTVKTDKPKYSLGSTVQITGKVASGSMVEGMKVLLQVYNPDGAAYRIDPVAVASDGSYSYSMPVGGPLGIAGTYEVKATYNGKQVKTTFDLGSSATAYSLKIADKTYQIEYGISSGSIKSMFAQVSDKKLVIAVNATEDGQLTLMLPRSVIDAIQDGKDIPFVVATTDLEAGAGSNANVDESSTNGTIRTVVIDYKKGTDLIEISGTSVVPEFGAISAIVLAIAIIGIIMATARFGSKFNFMRP